MSFQITLLNKSSQILFEAKDEVWIEDPAYRGTTAIFEHAVQNIRMVRVPVDE
ncbi:hypothetical protein HN302_20400, partial [Acinetobacter baumannii]|nr:hypothetical protein [Acinetobacter baumannii]